MSRRTLKIVGAVAGVIVCIVTILILVPPFPQQVPPKQGSIPTVEQPDNSTAVAPSPNSTPTEEPQSNTIDWNRVEIKEITKLEGTGVYQIGYIYSPVGDSWSTHFVYVNEDEYCPQAVKQAIEEDILARMAEIQEQERLKQEAEGALRS